MDLLNIKLKIFNMDSSSKQLSGNKVERRKVCCPICTKSYKYLGDHMRTVHKATKQEARNVLLDYNLRKTRVVLPENKRKSKLRIYTKRYV